MHGTLSYGKGYDLKHCPSSIPDLADNVLPKLTGSAEGMTNPSELCNIRSMFGMQLICTNNLLRAREGWRGDPASK
jgi:hypothetical protein